MDKIEFVRYVCGFGRAGGFSGADYIAAKSDPLASFADRIISHMNDDHADSITAMVNHYIGIPAKDCKILSLDRIGMTVTADVQLEGVGITKLRLPFIREATDRKAVKDILVRINTYIYI